MRGFRTVVSTLATLAASITLGAVVWWPATGTGFLGDDLEGIGLAVHGGAPTAGVAPAPLYRPLALGSLRLDHSRAGLDPGSYHVTNLVLAGVSAWLVGLLVLRLWHATDPAGGHTRVRSVGGGRLAAAGATTLFVLWPSHAEAVAWIGGRGDLLCAIGCTAALVAWLRVDDGPPTGRRWATVVLAAGALTAALAAKETAVVWPLVVTALVVGRRWARGDDVSERWRSARATWPLYAVTAVWLGWRAARLGSSIGGYGLDSFVAGAPSGPLTRTASVLGRSALPALRPSGWTVVAAAVTGIALLVAAVWAVRIPTAAPPDDAQPVRDGRRRVLWPWASLVCCWVLTAIPGAGLGTSASGSIGERLTYLSSIFVVAAAAWALGLVWQARPPVAAAVALALVPVTLLGQVGAMQRWTDAGRAGAELTRALGSLERDRPTVLLGVTDELGGAYVGRNAVPPTLGLLHGWSDPTGVWAATSVRSDGPVTTTVERLPTPSDAPGSTRWRVTVDGPGAAITDLFPRAATDRLGAVAVERIDGRTVEVTVEQAPDGRAESVVVLDGDRATVVSGPPGPAG